MNEGSAQTENKNFNKMTCKTQKRTSDYRILFPMSVQTKVPTNVERTNNIKVKCMRLLGQLLSDIAEQILSGLGLPLVGEGEGLPAGHAIR
jgi:hypothetical protein